MSEHTKEPWHIGQEEDCGWVDFYSHGNNEDMPIGSTRHENSLENARRIVACVNACAGMEDPMIKIEEYRLRAESAEHSMGIKRSPNDVMTVYGMTLHRILGLNAMNLELLSALKGVVRVADRNTDEFNSARAAIAKAEAL